MRVYTVMREVCPSNTMVEFRDFINYSASMDPPLRGGDSHGLQVGTREFIQGWIVF